MTTADKRAERPPGSRDSRPASSISAAQQEPSPSRVANDSDGRTSRGRLTQEQRRWCRQVPVLLRRYGALTDAELAAKLSTTAAELKPSLMALYGKQVIDFAAGHAFLSDRGRVA